MSQIEHEVRGKVVWLRINRPDTLNSIDEDAATELRDAVKGHLDAGVIVISGCGRGFCSGGYLADLATIDPLAVRRLYAATLDLFEAIRLAPAPVIAAVNGVAAGGGNELVVACDLAIAAESATFAQTGPRIGSSPVFGGANLAAMSVGEKRAKEISLLCRRYTASEAHAMGWINAVVPDAELDNEVMRWADELLAKSPRYLEITKMSSNVWWNMLRGTYTEGMGMLVQAIGSHDMREGALAFMEKRAPQFEPRERVGQ